MQPCQTETIGFLLHLSNQIIITLYIMYKSWATLTLQSFYYKAPLNQKWRNMQYKFHHWFLWRRECVYIISLTRQNNLNMQLTFLNNINLQFDLIKHLHNVRVLLQRTNQHNLNFSVHILYLKHKICRLLRTHQILWKDTRQSFEEIISDTIFSCRFSCTQWY